MRKLTRGWLLLMLLIGGAAQAHEINGMQIEDAVRIAGYDRVLKYSGAAILQRNYVPFYVTALHLPQSGALTTPLTDGLTPCRVTVIWLAPELSATQVREYWVEALKAAAVDGETFERIESRLDKFLELFGPAKRGEKLVFEYSPDAGLRVLAADLPLGQVAGVEFNRVLLRIWLGDHVPAEFRAALLAGGSP